MSVGREEASLSFKTQVAIAVIGLVGSLGGAWIASGARFNQELSASGDEIRILRQSLLDARDKLDEQQARIDKIDGEIEGAKKMAADLAIRTGKAAWDTAKGSFSRLPYLGSSKSEGPVEADAKE